MNRKTGMTTRRVLLLMGLLMAWAAGTVHAQMCGAGAMGSQAGAPMQAPGQMPMMGQGMGPMGMMGMMGMMGQGMGPMGMMGMTGQGAMDPKTRGQMLQMRGEVLKAMGDILIKYGQALGQAQ